MNNLFLFGAFFTGNQYIEGEPGVIVGPISTVLGGLINIIFNMVSAISPAGALGISIIIMTFIIRSIALPFSIKQFKSTQKMQALQPELQKIKDKYGDTKDPELKRKMLAEQQALQAKHGVNMFASCLPMIATMPIFITMIYVMRQTFLFIGSISDVYNMLGYALLALEPYAREGAIIFQAWPRIPAAMFPFDWSDLGSLSRLINVLNANDWAHIFANLNETAQTGYAYVPRPLTAAVNQAIADGRYYVTDPDYAYNWVIVRVATEVTPAQIAEISALHGQLLSTVSFIGLNLVSSPGLAWPGLLVPVLAAVTTFLQTKLMMNRNASGDANPQAQATQKMMMYVMPAMMGLFTIGISAGVGLYWIAGNIYAIVQQWLMNKFAAKPTPAIIEGGKAAKGK